MFLAIDAGNSSITFGIFDKDTLLKTFRIKADINTSANEYTDFIKKETEGYNITEGLICSVFMELNTIIEQSVENLFRKNFDFITPQMCPYIKLSEENIKKVGADRLANVCYAMNYDLPAILIDAGTAITFDIISKEKQFVGGIIMPGIDMQLKALYTGTSKLPLLKIIDSPSIIGTTTETSMLSGVIRGTAAAIDGLLLQCEKELGTKVTKLMTGGNYKTIYKYITSKIDVFDENVTLRGILSIYNNSLQRI